MNKIVNADRKIQLAASGILLDHPFFGNLLAHLKKVPSTQTKTFKVNSKEIVYNPQFVDTLSIAETKGILAHETLHVALTHHLRRMGREMSQWQESCDYVVNSIVSEAGFTLPDDALINSRFDNMSVEDVYKIIFMERPPQDQEEQGDNDNQEGGTGQGEGAGQGGDDDQEGDSDGQNNPPPPLSTGDFEDGPATEEDRTTDESNWKVRTIQAAHAARSQGKLPRQLKHLIKDIIKPKANWKAQLRDFVSATSKDGYTMMPPNRRMIHQGIYLPSLRSQTLNKIVIGVDTSASVSNDELTQFQSEINSILEENTEASAVVIQCDTRINDVTEYENSDLPIKMEARGRGGTSFDPVFDWVEDNGAEPDCLVYLTDLECNFPDQPGYPVLWASVADHTAPWGQTIHII